MYKHILVPDDGSELSAKAVQHAIALAKSVGASITAITVTTPFHTFSVDPGMVTDTPEEYAQRNAAAASKHLGEIAKAAQVAGVPCNLVHTENDQPYRAIIDAATSRACDLIVMASHGRRGIAALVLGSETVKVLTHSQVPILVCR